MNGFGNGLLFRFETRREYVQTGQRDAGQRRDDEQEPE